MEADISAYIRLAVTINILAALVATVLSLLIIGEQMFRNYVNKYNTGIGTAVSSVASSITRVKWVSGATAYRFVEERLPTTQKLVIILSSGTTEVDGIQSYASDILLQNAEKNFKVTVDSMGTGMYSITIEEVQ